MDEPKRKRTEITVETISVTTIRTRQAGRPAVYCSHCGHDVEPAEMPVASANDDKGCDAVIEMLRDGQIHRLADDNNCGHSTENNSGENK